MTSAFDPTMNGDPLVEPAFTIEVKADTGRVLVCPVGELDLATSSGLESTIVDLLERGNQRVVVDLRGLTFLDSTGIRALITAHHRARDLGAHMPLILGGATTRRVLEITGLLGYLETTDR
jgi:anti-sigma B factor antagonist